MVDRGRQGVAADHKCLCVDRIKGKYPGLAKIILKWPQKARDCQKGETVGRKGGTKGWVGVRG